ncbi:MAG: TfoX/Sxy family protein [Acidobacteriota bacterium]
MHVTSSFREFVLDQLAGVDGLWARSMFGGVGLYANDLFFGILAADELYFKVDDTNRRDYEAAGSAPFRPYADQPTTMGYYSVPIAVLEDERTLVEWAGRAVSVAATARKTKPAKARKPSAGATGKTAKRRIKRR